ncbi:MAG: radical SAM protein [Candidatus Omnitrophota bacterium]|nr:radical SAM protein [Candidatus Omnitrophota bacterium]
MKYIYGPVQSRRLGFSLGISLTPYKVCNFDCIYCQLGRTTVKTSLRKEYVNIKDVLRELREFILNPGSDNSRIDYISLSGAGEPLLNSGISSLIRGIRAITDIPIALITNASLLKNKTVRQEISGVDVILPSLDAIDKEAFEIIDRPGPNLKIENIINGLIELRKGFKGKIYLEVMIIAGVNDKLDVFSRFKQVISKINPDKIHLNTPKRHTSERGVLAPPEKILNKIKELLGPKCEII